MKKFINSFTGLFHIRHDDIRTALLELYHDPYLRLFIISALVINILAWLASILFVININDDVVALHHNIYFGINLIGSPKQALFIPTLGLILIIINTTFSYIIRHEDNFFKYIFNAASVLLNIFLLLGLGSIILINFR